MVDISRALKIEGWTHPPELLWLAHQASLRKNIAEIGSWRGRSAVAMALATKGVVTCVDTWEGTSENEHGKELEGKPSGWLFQEFTSNIADLRNVVAVRGKSAEVGRHVEPMFDMIFIDGDHSYEGCKADILAWRPKLMAGGLFCGHDFDGGRPGVVKAVRELVPGVRMAGVGSIWVMPAENILHLGCADDIRPGVTNMDPCINGWRFEKGLPNATGSVDGITISHALSFCPVDKLSYAFSEFYRVLRKGGVIRITDDDTESPTSMRHKEPWPAALWRTGPAAVGELLEEAGFSVFDCSATETHYPSSALLIAHREHKKPTYVFYIEAIAVKGD